MKLVKDKTYWLSIRAYVGPAVFTGLTYVDGIYPKFNKFKLPVAIPADTLNKREDDGCYHVLNGDENIVTLPDEIRDIKIHRDYIDVYLSEIA